MNTKFKKEKTPTIQTIKKKKKKKKTINQSINKIQSIHRILSHPYHIRGIYQQHRVALSQAQRHLLGGRDQTVARAREVHVLGDRLNLAE
jgi:hypothetical protein